MKILNLEYLHVAVEANTDPISVHPIPLDVVDLGVGQVLQDGVLHGFGLAIHIPNEHLPVICHSAHVVMRVRSPSHGIDRGCVSQMRTGELTHRDIRYPATGLLVRRDSQSC
jgi:hypothetical protein